MQRKTFVVAAKSSNYTNLGRRILALTDNKGESWQMLAPVIFEPEIGERLAVHVSPNGFPLFSEYGFETPERIGNAPKHAVTEIMSLPDPNVNYHCPENDDA